MRAPNGYLLGHPGALLPLPGKVGALKVARTNRTVLTPNAVGGVRALLPSRREPRTWQVTVPFLRPEDAASVIDLVTSRTTVAPYVWVTPQASSQNLMTPQDSVCDTANTPMVGRWPLSEGGYSAVGVTSYTPTVPVKFGVAPLSGVGPVTATVRCASPAGATVTLKLDQLDANGSVINFVTTSRTTLDLSALHPVTLTITDPHPAAVAVGLSVTGALVMARPQVTWTATAMPYGPGEGCPSAIVTDLEQDVVTASHSDPYYRRINLSFNVTELG